MAAIEARQNAAGEKTYRVKIRLRGHATETATFRRLTDAKRWAQSMEAAIREGRHFPSAAAKRYTVADMVDRYIREVLPLRPKNARNTRRHLEWWAAQIGHITLANLTAAEITRCRDALRISETRRNTHMSPSTVVRYTAALSHAFTIAINDWEWLEQSPMRRVSRIKEPRGRERFLSTGERDRLLQACRNSTNRFLYPVVVLAISTGMRKGEIMSLTWRRVDFARQQILLDETKNGSSRSVPLTGTALDLLQQLKPSDALGTALVFPGTDPKKPIELKKPWSLALRNAGIDDFRFHDLRHTAASYLAMDGASTLEIAALLGHKTLQMVKRYAHLSNEHVASRVADMNRKIFAESTPEPTRDPL
jgi:integrase